MENLSQPIILDGGLSNVLEAMGCNLEHPLWTAQLIETNPELIIEAHLIYLRAGANCITSAGYQASIEGYLQLGKSKKQAEELIILAIELACKAKELYLKESTSQQTIMIAASMGPYGAFLADGSEYSGLYDIPDKNLSFFHQQRIDLLKSTPADILAFETIPSLREVSILANLLLEEDKPSWISLSCKDEFRLNDGHKISEAISLIAEHPSIYAIGVNCTSPRYISKIIENIKRIILNPIFALVK